MIAVVQINGKGRGLIATRKIRKKREIISGPVLTFPAGTFDGSPIFDLVWWNGGNEHLTLAAHTLCNHSVNPNCKCKIRDGMDVLVAKRKIKRGEELTLDYREFE